MSVGSPRMHMSGSTAVVHQVVRADAVAAIFAAGELVAPLGLLDFADDGSDHDISLQAARPARCSAFTACV